MRPIYDKCIAWLDAITPDGVTVYVRDQNAPAPPAPRVTMRIIASTETAHWRSGINDDDQQNVVRWVGFTLALQVYGTDIFEAENIAAHMADMLYFSELRVEKMGRNVAFNRVILGPQSVDGIIGSRMEPRSVMDLQMSAARDLIYDIGPIEEVEMTGDVSSIPSEAVASIKP